MSTKTVFGIAGACLFSLAVLVGCGGGDSESTTGAGAPAPSASDSGNGDAAAAPEDTAAPAEPAEEPATDAEPAGAAAVSSGAAGTFSGVIKLNGGAPDAAILVQKGSTDVKDAEVCAADMILDESFVVGEGSGIANVFVYLRRAPRGYEGEVSEEPVVMDQKGCVFIPHAIVAQVGQPVNFRSSDAVAHNIHTYNERNESINQIIAPGSSEGLTVTYTRPESQPVAVKCDIHAWMSSYQLILDHPFMAVTDEDGRFEITGLPPGKHSFRIWHEKGEFLEREFEVEIKDGTGAEVELAYDADRFGGN